ncbi:MAG: hydrogenase [Candidatus Hydrogenedentes bacterium]|nr:hydrogenase [Candidatus Hydrogenedentota bacterium]
MLTPILLIAVPAVFGLICLSLPAPRWRLAVMVTGAWVNLGVIIWSWLAPHAPLKDEFIGVDPLGHLIVTVIGVLFAATSLHFVGYQRAALISQRVFLACMLALLTALNLVCVSQNLGLLWVALEASTLAGTPLIYFHGGARALEAAWKFLLMNSVGIALALLGVFCTALASVGAGEAVTLTINSLVLHGRQLDPAWLRTGFLLMLVGYGTKMGLAPLHSWLPDAHGEAPAPISALLSGAVLNAAFLAILRAYQVCQAANLGEFAGGWLIVLGLFSMAVASVFVVGQRHFKRLLAYSSVDHMGILAVAVGLGGVASYPAMLHVLHNVFYKGALFFVAGILGHSYGSYQIANIRGALRRYPLTGFLLLAALFAATGLPPFGLFYSEIGILFAAASSGHWWTLAAFALFLCIVFVGMVTAVLPMAFGGHSEPEAAAHTWDGGERWRYRAMAAPACLLIGLGFVLAVYQPSFVKEALDQAAAALGPHDTGAAIATAYAAGGGR